MGTNIYGDRKLVAVTAVPGATWLYGFRTNYDKADAATELGHVSAYGTGGLLDNIVLGCNAPKPTRVVRVRTAAGVDLQVSGGNESTFCSATKLSEAETAKWKIAKLYKRLVGGKGLFYVEMALSNPETAEGGTNTGGVIIRYAWKMPPFLQSKIIDTDKAALGIVESTGNTDNLVRGLRYPRPPRATFKAVGTASVGSRTTFVSPSKTDTLPTGWKLIS